MCLILARPLGGLKHGRSSSPTERKCEPSPQLGRKVQAVRSQGSGSCSPGPGRADGPGSGRGDSASPPPLGPPRWTPIPAPDPSLSAQPLSGRAHHDGT